MAVRPERFALLLIAVAATFAGVTVVALAHTESGGGGNDTLQGHDHRDVMYGNSGCDELLGRGANDHLEGGPSGCDKVRGMEGGSDAVIVWDDGVGNDEAYGGGGLGDYCYVGFQDWADYASCEVVLLP